MEKINGRFEYVYLIADTENYPKEKIFVIDNRQNSFQEIWIKRITVNCVLYKDLKWNSPVKTYDGRKDFFENALDCCHFWYYHVEPLRYAKAAIQITPIITGILYPKEVPVNCKVMVVLAISLKTWILGLYTVTK